MLLYTSAKIATVATICLAVARCTDIEEGGEKGWNEEKVVLSPVELVNLVRMEQQLVEATEQTENDVPTAAANSNESFEEEDDDADAEGPLKSRKIWSRWSKWSSCSASCGRGVVTRQRFCVSGRCAPGEREEQLRLCEEVPCTTPSLAAVSSSADGAASDPQLQDNSDQYAQY